MGRAQKCSNANNGGSVDMRRSSRTIGGKKRMSSGSVKHQDTSEKKNCRKRKAVNYEDDPSYSEEEDLDSEPGKQKKVAGFRCCSLLVAELMEKLSTKQRGWVKNIGFSSLQKLQGSRAPKSLAMWLIDRVDTTNGTLLVCGEHIDIRKNVKRMLNLPAGGMKVPQPIPGRAKAKIPRNGSSSREEKHSDHGRGQTAKEATKALLAENEDEASFCRSFVMLVLCIYLAPTTSLNINRGYYPALSDISMISMMDWCGFIADYLIKGIDEFRSSKASHVQVPGCVHILLLLYIDALVRHKALLLPPSLQLPEGVAPSHVVRSEHFAFLASSDVSSKNKDRTEYGLLQENLMGSNLERLQTNHGKEPQVSRGCEIDGLDLETDGSVCDELINVECVLDSMTNDIEDGRQRLFKEFQEKVVDHDKNTFSRYKKKIVTLFKCSTKNKQPSVCPQVVTNASATPGQKIDDVQPELNLPHGGMSNISTVGARAGCREEVNVDDSPVDEDLIIDAKSQHTMNEIEMNEDSTGSSTNSGTAVVSFMNVQAGNSFVDELSEVVKIAQQAAFEVSGHVPRPEETVTVSTSLSILSEAAITAGPPRFDTSPLVRVGSLHGQTKLGSLESIQHDDISPPTTFKSKDCFGSVLKPVYDDTPSSTVIAASSVLLGKSKLMPVEEVTQGTLPVQKASFALSLILAEEAPDSVDGDSNLNQAECTPEGENIAGTPQPDGKADELSECAESNESDEDAQSESIEIPNALGESNEADADAESESSELPNAVGDDGLLEGDYKNPMVQTPEVIQTPCYTNWDQEVIHVDALPISSLPADTIKIAPLQSEIPSGCIFKYGRSVSTYIVNSFDRQKQVGSSETRDADKRIYQYVLCKDAENTYKDHVSNSTVRVNSRKKPSSEGNRDGTKIQIKGYHVTRGEFVDSLKPNGKVSQSFMGLCSVAIMYDWGTDKRVIIDQATIRELMREKDKFDSSSVAARLQKFRLELVEEIFLPMLTGNHWILAVVDITEGKVEMHDSLIAPDSGENPHRNLWNRVSWNLEHAYGLAMRKSVHMFDFPCEYQKVKIQTNTKDCGIHVIQSMECYKAEDLIGHRKLKTLIPYRKYLSHVLVYHRFNDLNPMREGLPEQEL